MIQLVPEPLTPSEEKRLSALQAAVDKLSSYAEQVSQAKAAWDPRKLNTAKNKLFEACPGISRCAYCEDSAADEVDHLHPRDLFPHRVWDWMNFIPSCGPCNGPKSNRHAILTTAGYTEVTRKPKQGALPPKDGPSAWVDIRLEDPFDCLEVDILGDTFVMQPLEGITSDNRHRAEWTIQALRLNKGGLIQARRIAYGIYRAKLKEYIDYKMKGLSKDDLNRIQMEFAGLSHPTVWREIIRWQGEMAEWDELFAAAPEALYW